MSSWNKFADDNNLINLLNPIIYLSDCLIMKKKKK